MGAMRGHARGEFDWRSRTIFVFGNKSSRPAVWTVNELKRLNTNSNIQKHMNNKPNRILEVRHLPAKAEHLEHDRAHDGVDRRGFLKCMTWAGTGMLWTVSGGVLGSKILSPISGMAAEKAAGETRDFSFVQISDSHIGFNKPANTDVVGTLKQAIAKINALPTAPDFILHTGDLTHLSEPAEFDTLDQMLKATKAARIR